MVHFSVVVSAFAALCSLDIIGVAAYPFGMLPGDDPLPEELNNTHPFADFLKREHGDLGIRQDDKVELRIMPLGASIMSGVGSSTHSGLRKWLRMALRYDGYRVNMVGSKQHGSDMVDNDHEAVGGAIIAPHPNSQASIIQKQMADSRGYRPNVVIINGGTNNALNNLHVDVAYDKMNDILNTIWDDSMMRETCVILSTLLPTSNKDAQTRAEFINQQYRKLVTDRAKDKCIWLADMQSKSDEGFFSIDAPIWADNPKVHPNDEGHKRMAYVFYAAIKRALRAERGVKPPNPKESEAKEGCPKKFGDGQYAGGLTQHGWGEHDGTYVHESQGQDKPLFTVTSEWDRNQWRWARLFSRDFDDLLGWFEFAPNDHRFGVWKNLGSEDRSKAGEFVKIADLNMDLSCIPRGLHFIDMNGDGLDDIVCVNPEGNLYLSVNKGGVNGRTPPRFEKTPNGGLILNGKGEQRRVRLADIDGDGRADYGIVNDDGSVRFWRNGWVDDVPKYWQDLGVRVKLPKPSGVGNDISGLRFEDINGDGRDDWLWLNDYGRTTTYTNTRSCAQGKDGEGLNVAWRQGNLVGGGEYTHLGMRDYWDFDNDRYMQPRIHFARIYGTKPAFGNLGVQDYVFMEHIKDGDKHHFQIRVWRNKGSGGTKVVADGNKYCNMEGHDNGAMDYIWTWSTGKMKLFPNAGKKFISPGESFWRQDGHPEIWSPPGGLEWDRRDLHLADWDNDGDCDIIYVNPNNGNIRVFINDFKQKQTWNGAFREISAPNVWCGHKRGIGYEDLGVRFADLTGNGRADYLCIKSDGTIYGFTHEDDGRMIDRGQLKFSEEKDRANLRFADVNGDGKADMIWVDKFNGNGHVWYMEEPGNRGDLAGSYFKWEKVNDPVYDGNVAGSCMYYPDLDGNKRADMHSIKGTWTNEAETWFNPNCGLTDKEGDDPEGVVDPRLPVQPGNPVDGPGPGDPGNPDEGEEGDCRGLDDREWRKHNCEDKYIKDHTRWPIEEVWDGLDANGAWSSAVSFYICRNAQNGGRFSFSNVISDFFHGSPGVECGRFVESGNNCKDIGPQCIDAGPGAAGFHIINSMTRIYSLYWTSYAAIKDALAFVDINQLASDFGISKDDDKIDPALAIILDAVMLGYGFVMGPMWNKVINPKITGSGNAGAVKDTVNDLVKNSVTLGKDIYSRKQKERADDKTGLQTSVRNSMIDMADSWRETLSESSTKLWDGSPESVAQIGNLIMDGTMYHDNISVPARELELSFRKTMAAIAIPQSWYLSPDQIFPVIIREEIGCNESPRTDWLNTFIHYITRGAYNNRICGSATKDVSYWLLGPKKPKNSCSGGGLDDTNCDAWGNPTGWTQLNDKTYDVSPEDIVLGSIATWESNGRKNGFVQRELTDELLDIAERDNIRAPGMFNIPICSMVEARVNWENVYNSGSVWDNFPCDK